MTKRLIDYAEKHASICFENDAISPILYKEYGVNTGLRDEKGTGVLTGLTRISDIVSSKIIDGRMVPCDGELWYRGYRIEELISSIGDDASGFDKIAYLLLMGELPTQQQILEFSDLISQCRTLPTNFTRDVIMKAPSEDIMNSMTRSILTLASYDEREKDTDIANVIRQSMQLISIFPLLAIYGYQAYVHYVKHGSMVLHHPDPSLSAAENILMLLRTDRQYTWTEAKVLDTALILHMEHGGGNNSTFTTRVVTSSGSDTYSTIAAAMSSLKGPKHGGANIKVMEMIEYLSRHVSDYSDKDEIAAYLGKILDKETFDRQGLIYGMGHAVYSLSDPRERILRINIE